MKVHIIGNLNPFNIGSRLLILTLTNYLSTKIPLIQFTKESLFPSFEEKIYPMCRCRKSMKSSIILFTTSFIRVLLWKAFKMLNMDVTALLNEPLRQYYEANVIIELSGDGLCPPQSRSLWYSLTKIIFKLVNLISIASALLLNKKVVLYSASIGNLGILSPLANIILNKVELIAVRDHESLKYLKRIGVTKPIILFAPDAAFSITPIKKPPKNQHQPTVGFNISTEAVQHFHGKPQQIAEIMSSLITYVSENYDATILLIPFSIGGPFRYDDDRIFLNELLKKADRNNVHTVRSNDSNSIMNAIAKCDVLITTRMHPAIVSLLYGIPPLVISHSFKFHGLMELIECKDLLCFSSQINSETLKSKFRYIWENKETLHSRIEEKAFLLRNLSLEGLNKMTYILHKIINMK